MKHLILASALAAATVLSSVIPSQAASVVITSDHSIHHRMAMHPMRHHCFTKVEKVHSHGRTFTRETKVCR